MNLDAQVRLLLLQLRQESLRLVAVRATFTNEDFDQAARRRRADGLLLRRVRCCG